MITTYIAPPQPSILKAVIGIIVSIAFAFVISYGYGVFIAVSPIIYVNLLITVLFGYLIGIGVRIITKTFQITQKKTSIKTALVTGIVGWYFSWVVYILYFLNQTSLYENYFSDPLLLFKPVEVFKIILDINTLGLWEISGIPFNGWILTIVWLFEALIIICIPILLVLKQPLVPFSLNFNKWYKKYHLDKDFETISGRQNLIDEINKDCINKISTLGKGVANRYAQISIYYLEEENKQYLSIDNISTDRQGKNRNSTEIIHLLEINKVSAKELIEQYRGKKVFIFDY